MSGSGSPMIVTVIVPRRRARGERQRAAGGGVVDAGDVPCRSTVAKATVTGAGRRATA